MSNEPKNKNRFLSVFHREWEMYRTRDTAATRPFADKTSASASTAFDSSPAAGELRTLAKLTHCDLCWLSREIKNRTGKTYTEILQEKRLSQAAFLLQTTKIRVSDISLAVGYENVSYFHRLFVKRFGMAPRAYRLCK